MKPKDIRELSAAEIQQRITEEQQAIRDLTFRHTITPLDDPLTLRRKRREVARLKTILKEKSA
ncbi:MAG: 50S ribosomal protein L29 [Bacteroidota bacterium]